MQQALSAGALLTGVIAISVLIVANEPAAPPPQPVNYSHSQHVSYFAEGRHRAEMYGLHRDIGLFENNDVPEDLEKGQCQECHDGFVGSEIASGRIEACARCHRVFLRTTLTANAALRPCVGCHSGVANSPIATLPNIERCAACHPRPAADNVEDGVVSSYVSSNRRLEWKRVYDYLPGDIVFSHERHVALGRIDCERCHAGVREADRTLSLTTELIMEDCIACHEQAGASLDCLACHK